MLPTPHCARCGYANAVSWPRCRCCGRALVACSRQTRKARRLSLHRRQARTRRHGFRLRSRANTLSSEDLAAIIAAW